MSLEFPTQESRNVLKSRLIRERSVWSSAGIAPICPFCGKAIIQDGPDLHEAIISRGEARGNKALLEIVVRVEWNVVLVHHSVHISEGDTRENDDLAILQLLEFYGIVRLVDELSKLKSITKGSLIDDKIRRIYSLYERQAGLDDIQPGHDHGNG